MSSGFWLSARRVPGVTPSSLQDVRALDPLEGSAAGATIELHGHELLAEQRQHLGVPGAAVRALNVWLAHMGLKLHASRVSCTR